MPALFVTGRNTRVRSIDWARGACVLLMIQTHGLVLLRPGLRSGAMYRWLDWVDGLVAPGFLLISGCALALTHTAGSDRKALRRIAQIFAAACAVNAMWFSFIKEPWRLLRLDVLHAIAMGQLLALSLLRALSARPRWVSFAATAAGTAVLLSAPLFSQLDAPWAHLLNKRTDSLFPMVPWTGYVLLGVPLGRAVREGGLPSLRRALVGLGSVGAGLFVLSPWLRFYPPHDYYEFHPSYHGLRLASVCAALWLSACYEERRAASAQEALPLKGLIRVSALALPSYLIHMALLHYSVGSVSLAGLWAARGGWPSYAALTVLLCAATLGLARLYRAAEPKVRRAIQDWTQLAQSPSVAP